MLSFFVDVFADTITCCFFFALFVLTTFDVVYVNSVRFRQKDCSCHFLELNYRGLNLNFLKLAQLFIDGDIESNPEPTQKSLSGHSVKIKLFKRASKKCDFIENIYFNVASDPKIQNSFLNTIQPISLNIINPWSVTCPRTVESVE